jgi:hypothetical protein
MDSTVQLAEVLEQLRAIRHQNAEIISKLDGLMSDLNQVQTGTFASCVVNALNDINFALRR